MAAGLGFKDFTTGEVLTAADVDGYLMQGIWVFASAAARDAAVTSPQEGNFAYLKDTNVTTYYTGSAWANLDTTGMTNPMTTTGDTIYSSSGSTPARLGIGTAGQVLQVNSGATAPEWATPASGGAYTLLSTTTLSGSTTNITGISTSYKFLYVVFQGVYGTVNGNEIKIRFNNDSGNNYTTRNVRTDGTQIANAENGLVLTRLSNTNAGANFAVGTLLLPNYATSETKIWNVPGAGSDQQGDFKVGTYVSATAISELNFYIGGAGNYSGGTVKVYGVN